MRKLFVSLALLFAVAFCAVPFVALTGCGTLDKSGVYAGDQTLYTADVLIPTSYEIFHEFVTYEYQNRALLKGSPGITKAADNVRANSKQWIASAIALRDAYKADPTAANKTSLQTALDVLRAALNEATGYLTTSSLTTTTPAK